MYTQRIRNEWNSALVARESFNKTVTSLQELKRQKNTDDSLSSRMCRRIAQLRQCVR